MSMLGSMVEVSAVALPHLSHALRDRRILATLVLSSIHNIGSLMRCLLRLDFMQRFLPRFNLPFQTIVPEQLREHIIVRLVEVS
jgi:hypothetical protein